MSNQSRDEAEMLDKFTLSMYVNTVRSSGSCHFICGSSRVSFDNMRSLYNKGLQSSALKQDGSRYSCKGMWFVEDSIQYHKLAKKRDPITLSRKQWEQYILSKFADRKTGVQA